MTFHKTFGYNLLKRFPEANDFKANKMQRSHLFCSYNKPGPCLNMNNLIQIDN